MKIKTVDLTKAKSALTKVPVTKAILRAILSDVSEMDMDFILRMGVLKLNAWELFQCDFSQLTGAEHLTGSALSKFCRTLVETESFVYFDLALHCLNGKEVFRFPKNPEAPCRFGSYPEPMKSLNPKPADECFLTENREKFNYLITMTEDGFETHCISTPTKGPKTTFTAKRGKGHEFSSALVNYVSGDIISSARQWHTHTAQGADFYSFVSIGDNYEQHMTLMYDKNDVLRKSVEVNGDVIVYDADGDRILRISDESVGATAYEKRWDMKLVRTAASGDGHTDFEYELVGEFLAAYRMTRFGQRQFKCSVKQP
ncbi:hypothetical protein [Vibrio phage vB_VmeM-Yong XC32]|nr:hypothetical protein [Vibrio phage vB_VmeM-Yong XC31]QAX96512.1 hypothetical protein [Vibrio phage vB_VmeM-Yong XC32]QAX96829.1 hypothetical protein [Vibrio phage vB_VmeM-Yong MS31]